MFGYFLFNEYYFTENYFKKTFTNEVIFGNIKMDKPLVVYISYSVYYC